jgi:predicted nucleic acid-binding protein
VGGPGGILLDTNVIIDRDQYVFDPSERYGASILTRAEFELGIQVARDPHVRAARISRLDALDAEFAWLEFDKKSTTSYGIIAAAALPPGGAKIRSKDALIAAQAHRYGASLMTANATDFKPFSRLDFALSEFIKTYPTATYFAHRI